MLSQNGQGSYLCWLSERGRRTVFVGVDVVGVAQLPVSADILTAMQRSLVTNGHKLGAAKLSRFESAKPEEKSGTESSGDSRGI